MKIAGWWEGHRAGRPGENRASLCTTDRRNMGKKFSRYLPFTVAAVTAIAAAVAALAAISREPDVHLIEARHAAAEGDRRGCKTAGMTVVTEDEIGRVNCGVCLTWHECGGVR
jgi:hypothetical protein